MKKGITIRAYTPYALSEMFEEKVHLFILLLQQNFCATATYHRFSKNWTVPDISENIRMFLFLRISAGKQHMPAVVTKKNNRWKSNHLEKNSIINPFPNKPYSFQFSVTSFHVLTIDCPGYLKLYSTPGFNWWTGSSPEYKVLQASP